VIAERFHLSAAQWRLASVVDLVEELTKKVVLRVSCRLEGISDCWYTMQRVHFHSTAAAGVVDGSPGAFQSSCCGFPRLFK
jgi:hypothetical protein